MSGRAEDVFGIRKIVSLCGNRERVEGDGCTNVIRAGYRAQNGYQLQLDTSVFTCRSTVMFGAVEMGVHDGRTAYNVRMQAEGDIRVVGAEQSYQKSCHASSCISAPVHHLTYNR